MLLSALYKFSFIHSFKVREETLPEMSDGLAKTFVLKEPKDRDGTQLAINSEI